MPLNESTARRPSLTPQQMREAERSIFGMPSPAADSTAAQLSHLEIARMREIVHAHDREHNKIQSIDINKPPIRCVLPDGTESDVYVYQEYPRMLYYGGDVTQFVIVQNSRQFQKALEHGYTPEVAVAEPEPEPPPPEVQQVEHDDEAFERYLVEQRQASESEEAPATGKRKR